MFGRALDLAMARAHVAESEARGQAQEKLLAMLVDAGRLRDAGEARTVLAGYREALGLVRDRLRRLQEAPGPAHGAGAGTGAADLVLRGGAP